MLDKLNDTWSFLAIEDFRFFLLIAKKNIKNLVISTTLVSIFVLFISLNLEKKFISKATLVIPAEATNMVNIQDVYASDYVLNRINNQVAILKSEEVIEYILEDKENELEFTNLYSSIKVNPLTRIFKKKNKIDKNYIRSILRNNLTVKNIRMSDVLEISFISNSPKISQLALKNIIESYQRYEVDSRIKVTKYANSKISERLKDLTLQMEAAEKELANYKKINKLVDTGSVKELKIKEIQSISNNILETKQNKQRQQNDLISIKAANGDVDILLAIKDLSGRKEITNINNSISANENNIQSLLLVYTSEHPKVKQAYDLSVSLKNQLQKILDDAIEKKAFELSNLINFNQLSAVQLEKATEELRVIETKEAGMLNFLREVDSSRKLYESFLQRVKETNEMQSLQVSKLKIIEMPSLPGSPFSPNPKQNFTTSLFISFLFFYGLILYRELNSSIIKSPEAIEHLQIPQVGILPKVSNIKKGYHILQMFLEDNESNFSEAIRSSRAIIESKFEKNKSFLVTSSNPSEGKTSYAFNLALSLEKSSKVIFIEADIRRPSVLNSFYKFDKEIYGLGEIITGQAQLRSTIFKVPGTNLDIVTSGAKRFDMSDVVSKDQLKKFNDILKLEYDYLIIDSPPVQPVSDTLILAQSVDYNLFIVRSDSSRLLSFMSSIKKIQNVGAKIDGIILNDLDTSKDGYYYNYYNYDYSSYYAKKE